MTLRLRLLAVLLTAITVVAVAVGVVSTTFLRGPLLELIDSRLNATVQEIVESRVYTDYGTQRSLFPTPYRARIVEQDGTTIRDLGNPIQNADLPEVEPDQAKERAATVRNSSGEQWRIVATELPDGNVLVVGTSVQGIEDTVERQTQVSILVAIAALLVAAGVGMVLVSRSLKPLREVERTAERIMQGDLSLRVPPGRDEETRRLAGALNTMLDQLEESFAAQKASEERVRRFVSDASHELRTPLTTIRGFAELARPGSSGETADALDRIEGEAGRMGRLVEDLLLLARLDEQAPLNDTDVDLLLVALDTVADGRARGGAVEMGGAEEELTPVIVRGDEDRIRQVAANLLGNALEHSPTGTPVRITVHTENGHGVLTVADQGPGMSAEAAERAFDRFYRADPGRARKTGGSGLGLSIVKAVVEALHGEVELDTAPGRGASFKIRLPLTGNPKDEKGTSHLTVADES